MTLREKSSVGDAKEKANSGSPEKISDKSNDEGEFRKKYCKTRASISVVCSCFDTRRISIASYRIKSMQ